jgi:hypothetical protein
MVRNSCWAISAVYTSRASDEEAGEKAPLSVGSQTIPSPNNPADDGLAVNCSSTPAIRRKG